MKKLIILFLSIFSFLTSFSCIVYEEVSGREWRRYGYIRKGDEIFYGSYFEIKAAEPEKQSVKSKFKSKRQAEGADIETFQEINQCFGADKDYVYYQGIKFIKNKEFQILGSYSTSIAYRDGSTEYIKNYIVKNEEAVYNGLKVLMMDSETFELIYVNKSGLVYAQDKTGIYYKGEKKINDFIIKDGEYRILENSRYTYLITKYKVFIESDVIKNADSKSFDIFEKDVYLEAAKDKKNYYKNGLKMSSEERDKYFKINQNTVQ